MSEETPGSSHSVQLVQDSPKPLNLDLCFICQRSKDSTGSTKLTSTEDGRNTIISTSEKLKDGLIDRIDHTQRTNIKYHVKSCYSTYKKKGNRFVEDTSKRKPEEEDLDSPLTSPIVRPKRSKSIKSPELKNKPCIICDHVKCQGNTERVRIEKLEVAVRLLKATNFYKDAVHTRTIFMKDTGDVFAADVKYHPHCMNKYIKQFQRDVEKLLERNFESKDESDCIEKVFEELIATLNISTTGYAVSDLRDAVNEKLENYGE